MAGAAAAGAAAAGGEYAAGGVYAGAAGVEGAETAAGLDGAAGEDTRPRPLALGDFQSGRGSHLEPDALRARAGAGADGADGEETAGAAGAAGAAPPLQGRRAENGFNGRGYLVSVRRYEGSQPLKMN